MELFKQQQNDAQSVNQEQVQKQRRNFPSLARRGILQVSRFSLTTRRQVR